MILHVYMHIFVCEATGQVSGFRKNCPKSNVLNVWNKKKLTVRILKDKYRP